MSRRVPVQEIRGSDPTLLEVQLSEMLRRPLGQLAPINVMDLIELASTEGRPRSLNRGLGAFVDGVARQIADIPSGRSWEEFLGELEELEGARVPLRFREILAQEAERDERAADRIGLLLVRWAEQEPIPFELGTRKARVTRAESRPRSSSREPSSAPREGHRRRSSGAGARARSRAAPVSGDPERQRTIQELCLEKLARASENGLAEPVLIAGVRHQAREQ